MGASINLANCQDKKVPNKRDTADNARIDGDGVARGGERDPWIGMPLEQGAGWPGHAPTVAQSGSAAGRQEVTHCRSGPIEPSVTGRSPANCPPERDADNRTAHVGKGRHHIQ